VSRKAFVVSGLGRIIATAGLVLGTAGILAAAQNGAAARTTAEQKQSRYQIGVMERAHRRRRTWRHGDARSPQAVLPRPNAVSENAAQCAASASRVTAPFSVEVPSSRETLAWSFRTPIRTIWDWRVLKALQAHIEAAGDPNLRRRSSGLSCSWSDDDGHPQLGAGASTGATAAGP
jgi:hypothetical protein